MLCKVSFSFPLTPYAVLLTREILEMSALVLQSTVLLAFSGSIKEY